MAHSEEPRGGLGIVHWARLCFPTQGRRRTTHEQLAQLLLYPQVRASHDADTLYVTRATEQS